MTVISILSIQCGGDGGGGALVNMLNWKGCDRDTCGKPQISRQSFKTFVHFQSTSGVKWLGQCSIVALGTCGTVLR